MIDLAKEACTHPALNTGASGSYAIDSFAYSLFEADYLYKDLALLSISAKFKVSIFHPSSASFKWVGMVDCL